MAVDIWAVGVFTYFLMSGIIPFERESQKLYVDAIMAANFKFEPENIWNKVSEDAKDFIGECLIVDPTNRPTAEAALRHKVRSLSHFRSLHDSPHAISRRSG